MSEEIRHYLERIEDLRGQIRALVEPLNDEALNWRPVEGEDDHVTNSLAVMTLHTAGAEHFWIGEVIGRLPTTRDRDAEFVSQVSDATPLITRLDEISAESRTILERIGEKELTQVYQVRDFECTGRWTILHVIDHTALHLGHMQITYQLWNRGQGVDAPRWFQRLPGRTE